MRKDIFIDNNIAKNFANPLDPEYKKLIRWLIAYEVQNDEKDEKNAYLVVSNKLIAEYQRTTGLSTSATNISVIINKMTREGQLVKISNQDTKAFKRQYFTKKIRRRLTCNREDQDHIPVVLLSERKYALSLDENFISDLVNFPGFIVTAARRPQDLPYN